MAVEGSILQVSNVVKKYATVHAVNGIEFDVKANEIFALLGPNGAGKTTLVRMILGMLVPDQGAITYQLNSHNAWPSPGQLGYLPEDRGLYKDLPILRTLAYFGTLRGMPQARAKVAASSWLDKLDLGNRGVEKLQALSKGNQQKVQFAAAILHQPQFAILDEPFSGLDPLNQELFLGLIRGLRDQGMTILLSAHQMGLVERLADRVLLMSQGQSVLYGTLGSIRRQLGVANRVTLRVAATRDPQAVESLGARVRLQQENQNVFLNVPDYVPISEVVERCVQAWEITHIHTDQMSLHDLYLHALGPKATAVDRNTEVPDTWDEEGAADAPKMRMSAPFEVGGAS